MKPAARNTVEIAAYSHTTIGEYRDACICVHAYHGRADITFTSLNLCMCACVRLGVHTRIRVMFKAPRYREADVSITIIINK